MVFCGRPSKGCASCRKRRIKCDRIHPSCSQCLRSRVVCEGYRDPLDLSFRDENEKTAGKVRHQLETASLQRRRKEVTSTSTLKSNETVLQNFQNVVLSHATPSTRVLYQHDYADEGINFFMKKFVSMLLDGQSLRKAQIPIHQIMPWSEMYESKSLFNAVSSVGFAALSNVTKDPKYTILARRRFSLALTTVKIALQNPVKDKLESTFKSVILLSAFHLVSDPVCTNQDWSIHVEGGAALLQLTETKKSRDIPIRQQLKICLAIFSQYIGKKQPCSPNILNWCRTCSEFIDPEDEPAISLTRLLIQFTNLNAFIGKLPPSANSNILITKVVALDTSIGLWEENLPEEWAYRVISRPRGGDSKSGVLEKVYLYRDLWTLRIWNDYRWIRICMNDLIIRQLYSLHFTEAIDMAQVRQSMRTNTNMSREISTIITSEFTSRRPTTAGPFLLLHPLVVAASGIGVPEEVHQFAIDMLLNMGNQLGIAKALELAENAIQQRREWKLLLHDWLQQLN